MTGWDAAAVKRFEDAGRVQGVAALPNPVLVPSDVKQGAPKRRGPNKWEAAYAREQLEPRRLAGEIVRYDFEAISFRLGDGRYTPDYAAQMPDGRLEAHEVKGHLREAARVRLDYMREVWPGVRLWFATEGPGKWRVREWRATG